ncbi:MAG: phospho-N-acetylmuramoyl-pentapeptide-transferase [Simkaniaceae bacterium]
MIPLLLEYLQKSFLWKIPAAFFYLSTEMILASLTSLFLTIFLGPRFINKLYELKIGQNIRKKDCPLLGELHKKKQDTPTMGGVLILFAILASLFLWMNLRHLFTYILLLTVLWVGLIGGVDDYLKLKYKNTKGLRPRHKMLLQVIFGLVLSWAMLSPAATGYLGKYVEMPTAKENREAEVLHLYQYQKNYYFPFIKKPIIHASGGFLILSALFMLCVITGSSNAVNLTDGLDGLASGLIFFTAFVLAAVAFLSSNAQIADYLNILYIEGSREIAIFLCGVCGASLGFLWYNGHPAQVFMGDTGSLSLGALLGVCSILLRREVLLALTGGLFVAEAMSVILQVLSYRLRKGKRIFLCAPLHHHFEYKGWPETKVVLRFWIIGIILAMIGFASLKFQ